MRPRFKTWHLLILVAYCGISFSDLGGIPFAVSGVVALIHWNLFLVMKGDS